MTLDGVAVAVDPSPSTSFVPAVWPVRDAEGVRAAARLPATGLSACYDLHCEQVDCAGTGQDGETRKGVAWPSPRFEANEDSTVTDLLTGLVWGPAAPVASEPPRGMEVTWEEALAVVADLDQQRYRGHADWRLPNNNELGSLALGDTEAAGVDAKLRAAGVMVSPGTYWSSTWGSVPSDPLLVCGWRMLMSSGAQRSPTYPREDPIRADVLPVRGP